MRRTYTYSNAQRLCSLGRRFLSEGIRAGVIPGHCKTWAENAGVCSIFGMAIEYGAKTKEGETENLFSMAMQEIPAPLGSRFDGLEIRAESEAAS